jgi:hypothetical protein
MTSDLYLRDASGRVIATVADNPAIAPAPVKVCIHGAICEQCRA